MDNFGLLKLDVLRVAPHHRKDEVVDRWDRFVDWVEEGVEEILSCKLKKFIIISQ